MDTLRESGRSYRATFAMFAATATILAAGMLVVTVSKAATTEKHAVASAEPVVRSLTLKEWQLLAK